MAEKQQRRSTWAAVLLLKDNQTLPYDDPKLQGTEVL
jgi:hypothetical protein